jgi:hypothetical protein
MIVLCTDFGLAGIALNGGSAAERFALAPGPSRPGPPSRLRYVHLPG